MTADMRRIAFGMHYADAVRFEGTGRTVADIRRISMIEVDSVSMPSANPTVPDQAPGAS